MTAGEQGVFRCTMVQSPAPSEHDWHRGSFKRCLHMPFVIPYLSSGTGVLLAWHDLGKGGNEMKSFPFVEGDEMVQNSFAF